MSFREIVIKYKKEILITLICLGLREDIINTDDFYSYDNLSILNKYDRERVLINIILFKKLKFTTKMLKVSTINYKYQLKMAKSITKKT